MAFKVVVLCAAVLAYANAGLVAPGYAAPAYAAQAYAAPAYASQAYAAPAYAGYGGYAHAPVAVHAPHVGATSQSVVRSLGGNAAVSHYAKAVDSAFSSVRKYDTRITNDALSYAHAPVAAYAAPVAHAAYAAPVAHAAYAAPVAHAAYAAPVVAKAYAAPVAHGYASHGYAAPVAHGYAGHGYAGHGYAAPVVAKAYAAPIAHAGYAAPVAAYGHGQVVAKTAIAYSPASVVSHVNFDGLGVHYGW